MWGYIPPPPAVAKREPYDLVWLCSLCEQARARNKAPHRCVETLLPSELRYCKDCVELQTCQAYRDYGRD